MGGSYAIVADPKTLLGFLRPCAKGGSSMVQRIRELNEQSYAFTSGYSTDPVTPRSYLLTPSKVLGRKKLTIDNVRPLHDYRFDLVPH